jgi:hypothetical protein
MISRDLKDEEMKRLTLGAVAGDIASRAPHGAFPEAHDACLFQRQYRHDGCWEVVLTDLEGRIEE